MEFRMKSRSQYFCSQLSGFRETRPTLYTRKRVHILTVLKGLWAWKLSEARTVLLLLSEYSLEYLKIGTARQCGFLAMPRIQTLVVYIFGISKSRVNISTIGGDLAFHLTFSYCSPNIFVCCFLFPCTSTHINLQNKTPMNSYPTLQLWSSWNNLPTKVLCCGNFCISWGFSYWTHQKIPYNPNLGATWSQIYFSFQH